jgi:NACalpha-BTF3-like transcription factor
LLLALDAAMAIIRSHNSTTTIISYPLEPYYHYQYLIMAAEEQNTAKQLDSVTDNFEEQEVDATKAQQAMSAWSTGKQASALSEEDQVAVSKEDVELIMSELEVTEEVAKRTLRQVAVDVKEGESMVVAALRKMVSS